MADRLVSLS
nr:unnamed protein product [Callosobruchus chinensis]CAH7762470.1 unnamed protein product [Callosobruchus chinensis]CAI5837538.1 unnamed protein product [Callosobruchus analis]